MLTYKTEEHNKPCNYKQVCLEKRSSTGKGARASERTTEEQWPLLWHKAHAICTWSTYLWKGCFYFSAVRLQFFFSHSFHIANLTPPPPPPRLYLLHVLAWDTHQEISLWGADKTANEGSGSVVCHSCANRGYRCQMDVTLDWWWMRRYPRTM